MRGRRDGAGEVEQVAGAEHGALAGLEDNVELLARQPRLQLDGAALGADQNKLSDRSE